MDRMKKVSKFLGKIKRGFTLIELLAILIILGVIISIASIGATNVIRESKKESFRISVANYIRAAALEKYPDKSIQLYEVNDGVQSEKVSINGDIESWNGVFQIYNSKIYRLSVSNGEFCATSGYNESDITISNGDCNDVQYDNASPALVMLSAEKENAHSEVLNGAWSNENLRITLSSNVENQVLKYCIDQTDSCIPNIIYNEPFIHSTDGTRYIRYQSFSNGENNTIINSYLAKIEKTIPAVAISAKKISSGIDVVSGQWSNKALTITLTSILSSDSIIKYCADTTNECEPTTEYIKPFTYDEVGTGFIRYQITNGAGIKSSIFSYAANIDKEMPSIALIATKVIANVEIESGFWSDENLSIALNGTSFSNSTIKYCIDTTNECEPSIIYNSPFVYSTTGIRYIRYKITNIAGTNSDIDYYLAKIDRDMPIVTFNAAKEFAGTAVASETWSNQPLSIAMSATSTNSIESLKFCIDETDTCIPNTEYNEVFFNDIEGVSYIRYQAKSESGKITPIMRYVSKIDTTTPTVTLTASKVTAGTTVTSDVWSNQKLKFVLAKGTIGTSDSIIKYCIDTINTCIPTTTYSTNLTPSNIGIYYLRYKAVGGSGKESAVASYKAKIDPAPPTLAINVKKATTGTAVSSGTWSNENLKISFTPTSLSGSTIKYCIDTTNSCIPSTTYSAEFTHSTAGTRYIRYIMTNGAGAASELGSYLAKVSEPYIMSYDSNGGSTCTNKQIRYQFAYGDLCVPTKNGFDFDGWYLSETNNNGSGTKVIATTTVTNTAEHTLYAKWVAKTWYYAYVDNEFKTFDVPYNGIYKIEAWGAQGGSFASGDTKGIGGKGGYVSGKISLTTADALYIYIGKQGTDGVCNKFTQNNNGGGSCGGSDSNQYGRSGGGFTIVSRELLTLKCQMGSSSNSTKLANETAKLLLVAGGGGGGVITWLHGGAGGGTSGVKGIVSGYSTPLGGTQTGPGTGASSKLQAFNSCGGYTNNYNSNGMGGGGGGGFYGGAAGYGGSGAGGSSFVNTTLLTATQNIAGNAALPNPAGGDNIVGNTGSGKVRITFVSYEEDAQPPATTTTTTTTTTRTTTRTTTTAIPTCTCGTFPDSTSVYYCTQNGWILSGYTGASVPAICNNNSRTCNCFARGPAS